jgi:hypothetical protein
MGRTSAPVREGCQEGSWGGRVNHQKICYSPSSGPVVHVFRLGFWIPGAALPRRYSIAGLNVGLNVAAKVRACVSIPIRSIHSISCVVNKNYL